MSVEQAKAFFDKVKEDEALAQKLKDAQDAYKGDKSDKEATFAAVVIPVAKSAGFNFTVEDFKEAFGSGEGEASDDELDKVAGGDITDPIELPADDAIYWLRYWGRGY